MTERRGRILSLGALVGAVYLSSLLMGSVRAQSGFDRYAQIFGFWSDQPYLFGAHARIRWSNIPMMWGDQWAATPVGVTNYTSTYIETGLVKWCDFEDQSLPGDCGWDPGPRNRLTPYTSMRNFAGTQFQQRARNIPLSPNTDYTFFSVPKRRDALV
jgi:hypothetical protein